MIIPSTSSKLLIIVVDTDEHFPERVWTGDHSMECNRGYFVWCEKLLFFDTAAA